jgi:hypothetical protein
MRVTIPCMWRRLILLLAIAAAMAAPAAAPVAAESPIAEVICAPRAEMLLRLRGAEVAGVGMRQEDAVLEVWAKPSGDWTLVQSYANGTTCILAMGEAWEVRQPPPA